MVKTSLVGPDIALGDDILSALDEAKFPVTVALWLRETDEDDWTLVMSTPRRGEKDVYLTVVLALRGRVPAGLLPIRLESNRHPLIKALRKLFGKAASVGGMRLGLQSIAGIWIQDAYVYRIR